MSTVSTGSSVAGAIPSSEREAHSHVHFMCPLSAVPPPFVSQVLCVVHSVVTVNPVPLVLDIPVGGLVCASGVGGFTERCDFRVYRVFCVLFIASND